MLALRACLCATSNASTGPHHTASLAQWLTPGGPFSPPAPSAPPRLTSSRGAAATQRQAAADAQREKEEEDRRSAAERELAQNMTAYAKSVQADAKSQVLPPPPPPSFPRGSDYSQLRPGQGSYARAFPSAGEWL